MKKLSTKILAVLLACILCVMPVFATDITIDDTNATSERTLSVDESKVEVDAGNSDDVSIEVSDDESNDRHDSESSVLEISKNPKTFDAMMSSMMSDEYPFAYYQKLDNKFDIFEKMSKQEWSAFVTVLRYLTLDAISDISWENCTKENIDAIIGEYNKTIGYLYGSKKPKLKMDEFSFQYFEKYLKKTHKDDILNYDDYEKYLQSKLKCDVKQCLSVMEKMASELDEDAYTEHCDELTKLLVKCINASSQAYAMKQKQKDIELYRESDEKMSDALIDDDDRVLDESLRETVMPYANDTVFAFGAVGATEYKIDVVNYYYLNGKYKWDHKDHWSEGHLMTGKPNVAGGIDIFCANPTKIFQKGYYDSRPFPYNESIAKKIVAALYIQERQEHYAWLSSEQKYIAKQCLIWTFLNQQSRWVVPKTGSGITGSRIRLEFGNSITYPYPHNNRYISSDMYELVERCIKWGEANYTSFKNVSANYYIRRDGGGQPLARFSGTYDPKTYTTVTVRKEWSDYSNKYGKRPSSIKIRLMQRKNGGAEKQCAEHMLTANEGWTFTFKNLLLKDGSDNYSYRVVEDPNYWYQSSIKWDPNHSEWAKGVVSIVTNTFKPIPTSLSVKKVWDDWNNKYGHRPNSVNVGLYRKKQNAPSSTYTRMATATLSSNNNWYHEFNAVNTSNLWRKDADGQYWEYTIREETNLPNYTSSMSWTGNYTDGHKGTLTNRLDVGWAKLQKQSELPAITNDNRCYSLEGAEYWVYTNENLTSWMPKPLVTKADGSTNQLELPVGKYWVKEYKAPKGFKVDENVYPITVKRGETANITSTEPCLNDPGAITMTKTQKGPSTGNLPSLLGTEFTMRYYDGFYTKDELKSQTPKRTWVFAMKWNEKNQRYQLLFNEHYLVKEKSDDLYYWNNKTVLPLGTYALHESQHAPGYIFENGFIQDSNGNKIPTTDVYVTQVKDENGGIFIQGGHEYSSENTPKPTNIRLEKYDEANQPLDGVTFELHKKSDGTLVDTKTTDVNGIVEFNDVYPDTYEVIETKTKDGMQLLAKPIEIKAPMMLTEQEVIDNHIDKNQCSWSEGDQKWLLHTVTYKVTNESNLDLPETGGFGMKEVALPFTIGMILLVGICVLIFMRKRK